MLFLLALLRPACAAHYAGCSRSTSFVMGSFNVNRFRPEFAGAGLVFSRLSHNSLNTTMVVPTVAAGDNPSYVARLGSSLFACNSVIPGRVTEVYGMSYPPYVGTRSVDLGESPPSHIAAVPGAHGAIVVAPSVVSGFVHSFLSTSQKLVPADVFKVDASLGSFLLHPEEALASRQMKPNPHMTLPYGRGVIVPDLGADLVFYLSLSRTGKMRELDRVAVQVGDGPRHAVEHPNSHKLYIINELSRTIVTLCPSRGTHTLTVCDRHQILRTDVNGTAAAIRVSRDGRFLYASVRTDLRDDPRPGVIAAFALSYDGMITRRVGEWSSQGVHPRDFTIVESMFVQGACRSYIAVANRDSNNVVFLRRDRRSGEVGRVDLQYDISTPSSVLEL